MERWHRYSSVQGHVVIMKGDREGSKCDLSISLQSPDELVLGLLNGVEVFKLSNLKNSLATPNPAFQKEFLLLQV